jgi:hypothetical protein
MARRNAEPAIILRNTARGIVPATGFDAEQIALLPLNADLQARRLRVGRNKALDAWWLLCSRTADCLADASSSRSVSNNILLALNMVEEEALFGGGVRRVPMSLTDFSDEQLWRLVEAGKLHVTTSVIPGVDTDLLMKVVGR